MFTLDQVVPWGRSSSEYRRMFALSDADLESRILGCAPAKFAFPLLTLGSRPSPYVETVSQAIQRRGYAVSIENVPYEFQRGGHQMMRIGGQ